MTYTLFDLAHSFIGTSELQGAANNPLVQAFHAEDSPWFEDDSVPWCSSFLNFCCARFEDLPRSGRANARSWLTVGDGVSLSDARIGWDVLVMWRGSRDSTAGHVCLFAGMDGPDHVMGLGGNQSDRVSIARFTTERVLSVRRLHGEPRQEAGADELAARIRNNADEIGRLLAGTRA